MKILVFVLAIAAMMIIFIYGGIDNLKKEDQTKNSTHTEMSKKIIQVPENNSYLDKFASEQIQPKNNPTSSLPDNMPKRSVGGFMPSNFEGPSSPPSVVGPPGPPPGY